MKTIVVTKRARAVHSLLRRARRQNIILRSPEGHEFILAEIDDFSREIELTRKNKKLMAFLARRAAQKKTIGLADARRELGLD